MNVIKVIQMMKQGTAAHLAAGRWRNPSTMGAHRGKVCTS